MILQPPSTRVLAACSLAVFFLVVFIYLPSGDDSKPSREHKTNHDAQHSLGFDSFNWRKKKIPAPKPANATLDFQEIIYISMPHRTDRQDAMSLMAAQTGLKLKLMPGIKSEDMAETSWPLTEPPQDRSKMAWLGIWRAHADVWRYMIDNDIGSALIVEDDVDWDLNLKDIMGLFNWQLRYNNTMRKTERENDRHDACEYGCDWDQLFVGQCRNEPHPTDKTHQSYHDPNSPAISTADQDFIMEMTKHWNYTEKDANVRVISPTHEPLCTMGYAISAQGARRALYQIGGFKPISMAVDLEFMQHNREGRLTSFTMSPPVFTKWTTKGKGNSDNSYRKRRRWSVEGVEKRVDESDDESGTKDRLRERSEELGSSMAGGTSRGLRKSVRSSLRVLDGIVRTWRA